MPTYDHEIEQLRKDAALLAWVLTHPETAAEELKDARAGCNVGHDDVGARLELRVRPLRTKG